jgi:hypothetical protein
VWWCTPAILVGSLKMKDLWSGLAWARSEWNPISKITRTKNHKEWFKRQSTCLASTKPWVQTTVLPNNFFKKIREPNA